MDGLKKFHLHSLFVLLQILLVACEDDNNERVESWTCSSVTFHVTSCCGFFDGSDCNNYSPLFSALLGLNGTNPEIVFAMNDNAFVIFHDGRQVISGTRHVIEGGFKLLSQTDLLIVTSAVESGDSLKLNFDGEADFTQVEISFMRTGTAPYRR